METQLLQDLAVVMAAAGAMTLLCRWLKQPVVLGYLIAGFLLGPHTPPVSFVQDLRSIHTMAELGLVLLMFALGLEFNLAQLRQVGGRAALAAGMEIAGMIALGYAAGRAFGWSPMDSIFLGAILSISSTTIIVKVFTDLGMLRAEFAKAVFGILILEDIAAVLILSILSGVGASEGGAALAVKAFIGVGFFVVLFLLLGFTLVPRLIHWAARFHSKEISGILVLGLCFAGALLASRFGYSVALGAFLMGAVISSSREAHSVEEWVHPVRDMFSAIFFVSAGMLIDPQALWAFKWLILIIVLITVIGKVLTVSAGSLLAGYGIKQSFLISVSLSQIGEFSFVIASLGASRNLTSDFLYPVAVAVSSCTTLLTPYLIRYSESLVGTCTRLMPGFLHRALDRYEKWLNGWASAPPSPRTVIFSRYLVRLVVYAVLTATFFIVLQILSRVLDYSATAARMEIYQWILWFFAALAGYPLFLALSKYINHLMLLWITSLWTQGGTSYFQKINIHAFYRTLTVAALAALEGGVLFLARSWLPDAGWLSLSVSVVLVVILARRAGAFGQEKLERILDEAVGVATSEPTRKAVISEQRAFLDEKIGEVTLPAGARAVDKKIRDLDLRARTGASIVSIYRGGAHIANPAPDMALKAHDVLVLFGDEKQRRLALDIFLTEA